MIILGIDPGISGAACIYDAQIHKVLDVIDLPTEAWGKEKRHIDVHALLRWVADRDQRPDNCAIERVNAMPSIPDKSGKRRGMGSASAFRFGMVYGELRGAAAAMGIKIYDVMPGVWKELFELTGRDKDAARQMVLKLHPEVAGELKRKKDQGRAEAILIARWLALNRWEHD